MLDDFTKYIQMRGHDLSANDVYLIARSDGLDLIASIRMLRHVYGLSLIEAKEVTVIAKGLGKSLSDYQEKLIPALEQALTDID